MSDGGSRPAESGGDRWVRASPGQVHTELGEETVILDTAEGVYFGVEDVGAWIWRRIQEPVRVDELHADLVERYEVAAEKSRRDLEAFLEELLDRGLAEVSHGPDG